MEAANTASQSVSGPSKSDGKASNKENVAQAQNQIPTKDLLELEVHVIGEIIGGSNFDFDNAFCTYEFTAGKLWEVAGGETKGQTQVDYPEDPKDMFVWNHPIDVHYYTEVLQGWPKILLTVYKLDFYGAKELCGYGFAFIPCTTGTHEVTCPIWRPCGTAREEAACFFLGDAPKLKSLDVLYNKAKDDRCHVYSVSVGKVHLRLDIILRNFTPHNVKVTYAED